MLSFTNFFRSSPNSHDRSKFVLSLQTAVDPRPATAEHGTQRTIFVTHASYRGAFLISELITLITRTSRLTVRRRLHDDRLHREYRRRSHRRRHAVRMMMMMVMVQSRRVILLMMMMMVRMMVTAGLLVIIVIGSAVVALVMMVMAVVMIVVGRRAQRRGGRRR